MTLRDPSKRFMGKPCRHGHSGERYVSNGDCCECVVQAVKKYRESHPIHSKPVAGERMTPKLVVLLEEMRAAVRRDVAAIMAEPI